MQDEEGYVWILLVVDHFTKFQWAKAFKGKEAPPIAEYLYKIFTDGAILPERWHADNGGEFKNHHIDAVRELLAAGSGTYDGFVREEQEPYGRGEKTGSDNTQFRMPYSHGLPRNPSCQGLVERANRSLKEGMHKRMMSDGYKPGEDLVYDWVPYMENAIHLHNRKNVQMYGMVNQAS